MGFRKVSQVLAERSRRLPSVSFVASSIQSVDIPRDSVFKSLELTLQGGVSITYTGTYTTDALVSFGALVARIDVLIDGNRTVKSVTPWLCATKQLFATGNLGDRRSSAGSAVLTPPNPTADSGFAIGTTTQVTTIRETVSIFFEDILSQEPRQGTFLDTSGRSSAEIRFTFNAFSALASPANAATGITYGDNTLQISIKSREAQNLAGGKFADLKETTKTVQFSSQVTDSAVDINRGNYVRGIWLLARDGTTTRGLSSNCIQGLTLMANGFTPIKQYETMAQLQAENRQNYGLNVPFSNNASRLDGVAYLDLLNNRQSATALDARYLDNLQLLVSTAASGSGATYTNPVQLTIQTDEYVIPA